MYVVIYQKYKVYLLFTQDQKRFFGVALIDNCPAGVQKKVQQN